VAGIVKIDDLGQHLVERANRLAQSVGRGLLRMAPWLMKTLAVVGTAAMFLVGGGILTHGWPALHHAIEHLGQAMVAWPGGSVWSTVWPTLASGLFGIVAGGVVVGLMALVKWLRPARPAKIS